jgi:GTP pyrophosphokinase
VHSVECANVKNLLYNPEREIEVEWARASDEVYPISLVIETEDRPGILAGLTEVVARLEGNIRHFEAETVETGHGRIAMVLEVRDRKHLAKVQEAIAALAGVREVHRKRGQVQPSG